MASADIKTTPAILGIDRMLTLQDFEDSHAKYNAAPLMNEKLGLETSHVKALLNLILHYRQEKKIGFHIIHRHDELSVSIICLKEPLVTVNGTWNKPTITITKGSEKCQGPVNNSLHICNYGR